MQLSLFPKLALLAAFALAGVGVTSTQAHADATCTSFVSPLMDWARPRLRRVYVQGTSIQKDGRWASHSTGILHYDAATDRLVGDLSTTFSDRVKTVSAVGCTGADCNVAQTFWKNAADRATIQIARDGTVTLTSHTWGGTVTLSGSCRDGYLLFFDGWSLSTVDLTGFELPDIR